MISDGVISFVPSQAKPPQGFAKVCAEIAGVVGAGRDRSEVERAVVGRRPPS